MSPATTGRTAAPAAPHAPAPDAGEAIAAGAALSAWRKRMILGGVATMMVGIPTTILSAAWIAGAINGRPGPGVTPASLVGSLGVLAIVVGGLMARYGFAGPFPARLTGVPRNG